MNVPFGGSLTAVATLPEGARAVADDPFAERPPTWPKFALFVIIVCFIYSLLNQFGLVYKAVGFGKNLDENKPPKTNVVETVISTNLPSTNPPAK